MFFVTVTRHDSVLFSRVTECTGSVLEFLTFETRPLLDVFSGEYISEVEY